MTPIRGKRLPGASAGLLLIGSCAAPAPPGSPPPERSGPLPLSQVLVLEAAGIMPDDTVVAIPQGARRIVVLRRSAPDFGLFARMQLGDTALVPPDGSDTARLILRPVPGEYALDVEISGRLTTGATMVFSYGSHFLAPAGARARYGSDLQYERALAIGRVEDGKVVFLPTTRPGTDMVEAQLTGPGRYLVGAPR